MENNFPPVVRFGLESTYKDDITLYFRIGGNIIKSAVLYDTETKARLNITNGGYYKFKHRADRIENGLRGLDTERFELALEYETGPLSIDNNNLYLSVKADRNSLKAISSEIMSVIEMFDASGGMVYKSPSIGNESYETEFDILPGVYIVNIKTEKGHTHKQKILVK